MTDKVQKIREVIEKRYECWREKESKSHSIESEIRMSECKHLLLMLDSLQEESVSKDLEKAAIDFTNNLDNICGSIGEQTMNAFKAGAKWQKEHLWKPADGEDLPEIDREVIALVQDYPDDKDHLRVAFVHRPSGYIKVWNPDLGEEQVVEIEGYDKCGWNIPNVKYWLDCSMPKEIEL